MTKYATPTPHCEKSVQKQSVAYRVLVRKKGRPDKMKFRTDTYYVCEH